MKKTTAIIFVLVLCLSILTAASAEGSLKRGYEVVERKTHLFERLPDEHYGPESVVEYDAEHFAVFTDPETGYWGVGLKAECYPASEDDVHTFENAAIIVLNDIGYDNNRFANYDIRISIDRVTYASLNGTAVNEGADVLGVFGYSRDMETIGLLSGWGCRVQRDENGEILRDGEVWQVEDAAAYDTFGLCTEAEISVTALSKDGSELDPKNVGYTKWIAADLDKLQPEGCAEGYDPQYFDEQLILKDGFIYSYYVQQGNVLNIEGKVRVKDSDLGSGIKTGLTEGELAKRYSSVLLQQDKQTAHVNWRGCGSEEAPARTELVFMGAEKKPAAESTDYTVQYLEEGSEKEIADSKSVKGETVGSEVTESAIEIENYDLVSESSLSITLEKNADQNVIKFYYKKATSDYEVLYLEEGTDGQLAAPKTVKNQAVGDNVTEKAIDIENYELVSATPQDLTIARDAAQNVIKFYYKRALSDYEVRYLEEGTENQLAAPKTVKNQVVGYNVTEKAIDIENYDLVSATLQYLTISRDADQNIIKFYYRPMTVAYTVRYINRATGESVWPDKNVTDVEPGTHVIEYPEHVVGYKAMQPKYEWDVVGNEVKIFIYYTYEEPIN